MYSADINRLRKSLGLTSIQKQILIGSLLGDGYLYPTVSGKYAYLRIAHGPKQKNYLWWKYQFFNEWVLSPPRHQWQNKNKPELGDYYWFKTIAHPELLTYRKIFYENGTKIVPPNLDGIFDSILSLAIWYMDDGALSRKSLHLNTQSFSLEENMILLQTLKSNFGLNCRIHKSGNIGKGYIIYVPVREAKMFLSLVGPYLKNCMPYKTFLTP